MPYYYPHAFQHFLNRYFCALCRHRFRVIIGGSCDHAGSPCLVSSSISSRKNSVCFFIVFRNISASCSPIAANARRSASISGTTILSLSLIHLSYLLLWTSCYSNSVSPSSPEPLPDIPILSSWKICLRSPRSYECPSYPVPWIHNQGL